MKKIIAIIMPMILTASCLTACGGGPASTEVPGVNLTEEDATDDIEVFRDLVAATIGDAMSYETEGSQYAAYNNMFVYVFTLNNVTYRVFSHLDDAAFNELMELNMFDDDYEEKFNAIVGPLPIEGFDNLTLMIPTQEELDALIGKTGEELFNDGWGSFGFTLYDMQCFMEKGPFSYNVTFDGSYEDPDNVPEDFDGDAFFAPLKVTAIEYTGIGSSATEIDDLAG